MIGISLALSLGNPVLSGGTSPVTITSGIALYGDSFADGGSGGGGESAYGSLRPSIQRYLAAANMPTTALNMGVGGETSTQTLARWLARTEHYRWNVYWTGRNDVADPATVLANAAAAIADMETGEHLFMLSAHNISYDMTSGLPAEPTGTTNFNKIAEINAGLSALANGTTVFYIDTLAECLHHYAIGNSTDENSVAAGLPPPSLVADGLHLNGMGTNVAARMIFWQCFQLWLLDNPKSNLAVNGDFATNVSGWTAGADTTLTWNVGTMVVAGSGAFKQAGQSLGLSGQNGKRFMLVWDMVDLYWGGFKFYGRPFLGGGSNFGSPDGFSAFTYGTSPGFETPGIDSARRRGHKQITFFNSNNDAAAFMSEAINDASTTWTLDNVALYDVT